MKYIILLFSLGLPLGTLAQKFISEKSAVTFFSKATVENISAKNEKSICLFDVATGNIAFSISIQDFQFEKSLMQEHFNEKYMETEKFPKSTFQGKLVGYSQEAKGSQPAHAQGKLTIHGVTKDVDIPGTVTYDQNRMILASKFVVLLEDYSIQLPQILWQNIAEAIEVSLEFTLKPYEK